MKIVQLSAENFKKLRAVEINPKGEIVTIAGKNGAGKSSTLDAIWAVLAGAGHIQSQPIRKGETKARIRLNLGELIAERRFTEKGSTVVVESAEGARFPSPQRMLDDLIGELCFDPLAFARMEPRSQFDELRKISKLEVDIDQLDGLNKGDYSKRTDLNRDAKAIRARADGIVVAADLPTEPLDETALLNEMQEAGEKNGLIERARSKRKERQDEANRLKRSGVDRRNQSAKLREQANMVDQDASKDLQAAADIEKEIDDSAPLPAPVDVAAIRVKLEHAKQVNSKLTARNQRLDLEQQATGLEAGAKEITERMEAREKAKADAIAAAQMPVPGIGFGDGIITFNGVPFDQASTAEQLRVSVSIAMAANPKLKVILIKDGSLLDSDSLATIAQMAKASDYQVWIETVTVGSGVGFEIADGVVVTVDGKPVEAKAAA